MANKQIETVSHRVALAGRVVEAGSNDAKPLSGALVRIVAAPSEFILPLITCANLIRSTDQVVKCLQSALAAPSSSADLRLALAQLLLDYDWLTAGPRVARLVFRLRSLLGAESEPLTVDKLKPARVLLDGSLASSATTPLTNPSGYAVTPATGYFYWLDLPAGSYTLTAWLPGAGTGYGIGEPKQLAVAKDAKATECQQFELLPTGVQGRLVEANGQPAAEKKAVTMAEVRVKGDNARVFTNMQGEFRLLGLEACKDRAVLITKRVCKRSGDDVKPSYISTYVSTEKLVSLTQGTVVNLGEIQL